MTRNKWQAVGAAVLFFVCTFGCMMASQMEGGAGGGVGEMRSAAEDRAWREAAQVKELPVADSIIHVDAKLSHSGLRWEGHAYGFEVLIGPHAVDRHGQQAVAVRNHFTAKVNANADFLRRPPCKDGRIRVASRIEGSKWAVWVLKEISSGVYQEITAFTTYDESYIQKVREDCGNDSWLGLTGSH